MTNTRNAKDETDKLPLARVFGEFAPALLAVAELTEFGRAKYEKTDTWQHSKNGVETYYSALLRHLMAFLQGDEVDPESGLNHSKAVAWNALAALWHVEKQGNKEASDLVPASFPRQAYIESKPVEEARALPPRATPPPRTRFTICQKYGCNTRVYVEQTHCEKCGTARNYSPL